MKMELVRGKPTVAQYNTEMKRVADKSLPWTCLPEVPGSASFHCQQQIPRYEEKLKRTDVNLIDKPWPSKDSYLRTHFKLLREDALRPLQDAVRAFFLTPTMFETPRMKTMGIYDNVHIEGYTCSNRGLGARLSFSLRRVGKAVKWKLSKRLLTGSLVALIPKLDPQTCIPAVIAARPLSGLEKSIPEIHVLFADAYDSLVDSSAEYVMIEDRASFFEAARHTLRSLQKMTGEIFPMHEHIVNLETHIAMPCYLSKDPIMRLSSSPDMMAVNVVQDWPENSPSTSSLDDSQWVSIQNILTKRLSVIQGPPGTGKTYVSVQAIKTLLDNAKHGSSPIVLACQTNHALDQLLTQVSVFEPNFVRLGGRSTNPDIQKRTPYEIRQTSTVPSCRPLNKAKKRLRELAGSMKALLAPLQDNGYLSKPEIFESYGILSHAQLESLHRGATVWSNGAQSQEARPLKLWSSNKLVQQRNIQPVCHFSNVERHDIEAEELGDAEAERLSRDDEDEREILIGPEIRFTNHLVATIPPKQNMNAARLLKDKQDLWKVPKPFRGALYNFMVLRLKAAIQMKFRVLAKQYEVIVEQRRSIMMEEDAKMISRGVRVLGVTTTGLSKYRALLYSLQPKVILIEEAAETLEASCVPACLPSLEHLILIGDHKQLRPQCHLKSLAGAPRFLDVSLFERLVENGIEFRALNKQRRMVPEIAKILHPIYGENITNHPDMILGMNRPQVAGMGKRRLHFFAHESVEDLDEQGSAFNVFEVEMTISFARYLIRNGTDPAGIVILTFYNGQRRRLLRLLSSFVHDSEMETIRVRTVDSFQGEEAEIILLSLVRSNTIGKIGFLNIQNRVCVALSRAQRGLYMFGNARMLMNASNLWEKIIGLLASQVDAKGRNRGLVRNALPLRCTYHDQRITVNKPSQLESSNVGCGQRCAVNMRCGHLCKKPCHLSMVACDCMEPCGTDYVCLSQTVLGLADSEVQTLESQAHPTSEAEGQPDHFNGYSLISVETNTQVSRMPDEYLIALSDTAHNDPSQNASPFLTSDSTIIGHTRSPDEVTGRYYGLSLLD